MNGFKTILLSTQLFLIAMFAYGQTGVQYFLNDNLEFPNSKIVDLIETDNSNLVLLAELSDEKYKMHQVDLIKVNLNNKEISNNIIAVDNLYNLLFLKKEGNSMKVFGNSSLNKAYKPLTLTLNKTCELESKTEEPVVFSTLISDIIEGINYRLVLYTKVGKAEKYNISLHKINLVSGKVEWLKKISSEQNEEADKVVIGPEGNLFILGKKYNDEVTEYVPIIYKLDANGEQVWKKAIDVPSNFNKQSITISNESHIIYICGYTKNPTGFSESRIIKFSEHGEEITNTEITDFSANGILKLANGNYLVYGSKFLVDQKQIITKGKYALVGKNLSLLKSKALNEKDKPDCDLNTGIKTSSDFLAAKELSSGKIALGGKVYMPINEVKKNNVPLLLIINGDGNY